MSNKQTKHPTQSPKKGGRRSVSKTSSADRWEQGKVAGDKYDVARSVLTALCKKGQLQFNCGDDLVVIQKGAEHLKLSKDKGDIDTLHRVSMAYAQSFMESTNDDTFNGSNNKNWYAKVVDTFRGEGTATALLTDTRMIIGAMIFHQVKISTYEHEKQTIVCDLPDELNNFVGTDRIILTKWVRLSGTTIDLQWTPGFVDINQVLFGVGTNPFTPSPEDVTFVRGIINSLTQDKEPDIDDHFAGAFAIVPLHILQMPGVLELVLGRILPKLFEIMQREEYTGPNTMTSGMLDELVEASVGKGFNYKQYVSQLNSGSDDDDSDNGSIVDDDGETKLNKKNQRGVYFQVSHDTTGNRRKQFEEFISRHGSDETYCKLVKHMERWLESNKDMEGDDEQIDNQLYVGMAARQSIWNRLAREAHPTKMDGAKLLWMFIHFFGTDLIRIVLAQVDEDSTRQGLFYEGLILGILQSTAKRTCSEFKLLTKPNGSALNQVNGGLAGFLRKGGGGAADLVNWFMQNSESLGDHPVATSLEIPTNVTSYLWYWENDVLEFLTGKTPSSPVSKKWGQLGWVGCIGDVSVSMLHSFVCMHGGKSTVSEPMLDARLLVADTTITTANAEEIYEQIDDLFRKWTTSDNASPTHKVLMKRWKMLFGNMSLEKHNFLWSIHEKKKEAREAAMRKAENDAANERNQLLNIGRSNLEMLNDSMP